MGRPSAGRGIAHVHPRRPLPSTEPLAAASDGLNAAAPAINPFRNISEIVASTFWHIHAGWLHASIPGLPCLVVPASSEPLSRFDANLVRDKFGERHEGLEEAGRVKGFPLAQTYATHCELDFVDTTLLMVSLRWA